MLFFKKKCKHIYKDLGPGASRSRVIYRCTICGKEKSMFFGPRVGRFEAKLIKEGRFVEWEPF